MGVTGDGSKVQCCKEQYCLGIWNVKSMNQGKRSGQTGDGESEYQHFRNQRTKVDSNGCNLTEMIIIYTIVGKNHLQEVGWLS